jgi:hypothetical protein
MISITDARRNLATHFRSVHVSMRRPDGTPDGTAGLQPSVSELVRWLHEYQLAFVDAHGDAGYALHGLHGRSLTLEGEGLLEATEDIALLAETAARCGLTTTLAVAVSALAALPHAIAALRAAAPALGYRIDCGTLHAQASEQALKACRSALAEHVSHGGNLSMAGDVAALRATGMFAEELFNETFLTLHARPFPGVRHQQKPRQFSPCRDYIAWFVDAAGDIYPCAGLAGHAPARLGSIHDSFSNLLDALAYTAPRIDELSRCGPRVAVNGSEASEFPADLCALHRRSVHGISSI